MVEWTLNKYVPYWNWHDDDMSLKISVYDRRSCALSSDIAICLGSVGSLGFHTIDGVNHWVKDELELYCKLIELGVPPEVLTGGNDELGQK